MLKKYEIVAKGTIQNDIKKKVIKACNDVNAKSNAYDEFKNEFILDKFTILSVKEISG
jgi:hypothetical protein